MTEEKSLIRKVQKSGDRVAADVLVRKYYDEIFKFIRKQIQNETEALDITQETFIGLLRTINHYDATSASFRTWLYRIATNKLIDYYRRGSNKILFEPLILDETEPIDEGEFTKQIQDGMIAEKIWEYVGQLSPDLQKILRLHIWGEHTFKEIGKAMELPESSVKSKYYRLMTLLRKEFSQYG